MLPLPNTPIAGASPPSKRFYDWMQGIERAVNGGTLTPADANAAIAIIANVLGATTGNVSDIDFNAAVLAALPPGLLSFAANGTTDGVPEGDSNLYFTPERARRAVPVPVYGCDHDDAPIVPGPQGRPGRDSVAVAPIYLPADAPDDPLLIPGPRGADGTQGASAPPIYFPGEPGEDALPIPGPSGPMGPAGEMRTQYVLLAADEPEAPLMIPGPAGAVPAGLPSVVVLPSDVIVSSTSIADITGLTFTVPIGKKYRFRAVIVFDAVSSAMNGALWTISVTGAGNAKSYRSESPKTGASRQFNDGLFLDDGGTASASTATDSDNIGIVEGVVTAAAVAAVVQFRFAASNVRAITARGGLSYVEYAPLN